MVDQPPDDMKESIVETRWNRDFEKLANDLRPTLKRWTRVPQRLVEFRPDPKSFFGLKPVTSTHAVSDLDTITWGKDDEFVLDFGIHMVGYFSFKLDFKGSNMDAPCRLHLTFGESYFDVTMGMDNVRTWLSTAWLPDETINVDVCPETVSLHRRQSFRYLRIRVVDVSPKYSVKFSDIKCKCVSAIGQNYTIEDYEYNESLFQSIDLVSIYTLRDCMQTVFEDGPRRDRRLWIGDLRLQALTNYYTFKDYDLVKRCIYLFAAVARVDGSIPACVFEYPSLSPSTDYIVDYDALFTSVVYDYVLASGDMQVGHDLWPTILGCLKGALAHISLETNTFDSRRAEGWKFLDWAPGLDHCAGLHGVLLYSLKAADKLAKLLDKPAPYTELVSTLTTAASHFLSPDLVVVSGPGRQISYASAAWLILAEAFPPKTARAALLNTMSHPDAVKPLTPYLWHHVCDALATVDCHEESIAIIRSYWGGMVNAGADTFWECFDEMDARKSPYGDVRNNSFCHAWSCTGSYLLRGKLKEFVGGRRDGMVEMGEIDERWIAKTSKEM